MSSDGMEGTVGTDADASSSSDGGSAESDTDTGEPATDIPARGLRISAVEANQGVSVNIGVGTAWVNGTERNAPLIAGRDTLLRVYWEFDADWQPREMEARVTFYPPEGEPYTETQRKVIDIESTPKFFDRSFSFSITAEEAVAGLKYEASLWELDPSQGDRPEPATPPVNPIDGPNWVGFETGAMQLKIHVVPFNSNWQGCVREPDTSDVVKARFEEIMFQRNATHEVEITWEPPEEITFQPNSFQQLFGYLDERRVANGLLPNVYYYGLIDACTGDLDGAGGLAMTIPSDSMDAGFQRISAGLSLGLDWSATTFVHEVGHTQGLMHAYCASEPNSGPDPNYPYDDARIGSWGFGIRDFIIRDAQNSRDYMSYCYNGSWASDYHWWKTLTRIRTLTSWEESGDAVDPDAYSQPILVSMVDGQGRVSSYVTTGAVAEDFGDRQAVFIETLAGTQLELDGRSRAMPDGDGRLVVAPWPGLDADPVELVLPGMGRATGEDLIRLRSSH